jgi:hypothetical protein
MNVGRLMTPPVRDVVAGTLIEVGPYATDANILWRGRATTAVLGGGQSVHPPHVPRHGDEAPLALDAVEASQKELAEAHHRLDDAEHRFGDLLAQGRVSYLRASADGGA